MFSVIKSVFGVGSAKLTLKEILRRQNADFLFLEYTNHLCWTISPLGIIFVKTHMSALCDKVICFFS